MHKNPIQRILIRAESKANEQRVALTPKHVGQLILAGIEVWVEKSSQRIFADQDYEQMGALVVPTGSWKNLAPALRAETLILGLKELDHDDQPLSGQHCYFGHLFKGQTGATEILKQFSEGSGALYDLEYLVDDSRRRIAAFGFWAGYAGAAVGLLAYAAKKRGETLGTLNPYSHREELIAAVKSVLAGDSPNVIVTGAKGRCGAGATQLLNDCIDSPRAQYWDLEETKSGGPFSALLDTDVLIHAVGNQKVLPPFLNNETFIKNSGTLSVVVDVTCDLGNPTHLLPFVSESTSFVTPVKRTKLGQLEVDLVAIDHLPTLLPRESSEDFSNQLLPYLMGALKSEPEKLAVFERAHVIFEEARMAAGKLI